MPQQKRKPLIFLTIPGLRGIDLSQMPRLQSLVSRGRRGSLEHSFPAVTWPSQTNMLTGRLPSDHGVIANGFFWRNESGPKKNTVEMWTAWNEVIERPQLWDVIGQRFPGLKSAAWFPMLSKGCGADYVCMPAPIHQPDGSEEMWCYTKPQEFYGQLLDRLGHFPLQHFWGPLASIKSSQWIADSAVLAAEKFRPDFFYIYLPHLDYAAQKFGPDSPAARTAVSELDQLLGQFADQLQDAYKGDLAWLVASEYVIGDVDHVTFPNRLLRQNDLLKVVEQDGREHIDFDQTPAWALVDHQFSHVFVQGSDRQVIQQVRDTLSEVDGIHIVLDRQQQRQWQIDHSRSGDLIVVSERNSWQAYYWWLSDQQAPKFASTVDIHRKPGYDPVELFFDAATKSVPLDATLIRGSHGVTHPEASKQGVVLATDGLLTAEQYLDTDLFDVVLSHFR